MWGISGVMEFPENVNISRTLLEGLILDARTLGRTQAMEHIHTLVDEFKRIAGRYKHDPKFTLIHGAFEQCAEMLENKIDAYENS